MPDAFHVKPTNNKSMKHIPGAEGMRGIACLIVVILHNTGPFIPAIAQYTKGTEKYGVWIFFVLSAFLLTCKILDNERSLPALGSYYISRTFRIIPPFIVAAYTYYIFWIF
ncbi:acyltransferase family protein [Enterobacter kobei]|uniref:acyltransferase family protein n=1 Tax=Enterobacter kobei TaxID=208224 RepID=UPI0037094EC5